MIRVYFQSFHARRTLQVLCVALGLVDQARAAESASWGLRHDARQAVKSTFCWGPSSNPIRELWKKNVFDAQVQVKAVNPQVTLKRESFEHFLSKTLKGARKRGATWGSCDDGRKWVALFHSPSPVSKKAAEVRFPASTLRAFCRRLALDFAPTDRIHVKRLRLNENGSLQTSELGRGVIGVSCWPRQYHNLGPQTWFLLPVGGPLSLRPPSHQLLKPGRKNPIGTWVNTLRKKVKLPPISFATKALKQATTPLSEIQTPQHNLMKMQEAHQNLQKKGFSLVAENKVIANSLEHAIWLMWNSPRHRRLFFRKDFDFIAVHKSQTSQHIHIAIAAIKKNTTLEQLKVKKGGSL